jgi:hypothetical protein
VNLSAATLALRRTAGVLTEPLSPTAFIVVILSSAWAAGLARHFYLHRPHRDPRSRAGQAGGDRSRCGALSRLWLSVAPSLSLVVLLAALAVPGTGTRPLAVAGLVLFVEELIVWIGAGLAAGKRAEPGGTNDPPGALSRPVAALAIPGVKVEPGDGLYQRIVRHRLAEGLDHVEADCVAQFERGQRHAVEHLAFCPPFASAPQVHCEQTSGPAARFSAIRPLPYGARIELRLSAPAATRTKVAFRLTATAPAAVSAASA